jgi:outer membrane protein assembly factor BamD
MSYLKQYPGSQDADYVQYLVGSSYAKQIVDVTQDQRAAQQTIEAKSARETTRAVFFTPTDPATTM